MTGKQPESRRKAAGPQKQTVDLDALRELLTRADGMTVSIPHISEHAQRLMNTIGVRTYRSMIWRQPEREVVAVTGVLRELGQRGWTVTALRDVSRREIVAMACWEGGPT